MYEKKVPLEKIIEKFTSEGNLSWQKTSRDVCSFSEGRGCLTNLSGFTYIVGSNHGIDEFTNNWYSLKVYKDDEQVASYMEDETNPPGPLGRIYNNARDVIREKEEREKKEILRKGEEKSKGLSEIFYAQYQS